MPEIVLPFPRNRITGRVRGAAPTSLRKYPDALRKAAEKHTHLRAYLQGLPVDKMGVPLYCPELSRSLQGLKEPNLIYPTKEGLFVHIYPDATGSRHLYIPITPELPVELNGTIEEVDLRLLNYAEEIGQAEDRARAKFFSTASTGSVRRGPAPTTACCAYRSR